MYSENASLVIVIIPIIVGIAILLEEYVPKKVLRKSKDVIKAIGYKIISKIYSLLSWISMQALILILSLRISIPYFLMIFFNILTAVIVFTFEGLQEVVKTNTTWSFISDYGISMLIAAGYVFGITKVASYINGIEHDYEREHFATIYSAILHANLNSVLFVMMMLGGDVKKFAVVFFLSQMIDYKEIAKSACQKSLLNTVKQIIRNKIELLRHRDKLQMQLLGIFFLPAIIVPLLIAAGTAHYLVALIMSGIILLVIVILNYFRVIKQLLDII